MKINNIFSTNLIRFRKIKGFSQRELAKKVVLSDRMISYYEKEPQSIQFEKLKALADSLDVQISDFFNDNNGKTALIENLDVRWIKKLNELKNLSENDIKEINNHINYLLEKNNSKNKNNNA